MIEEGIVKAIQFIKPRWFRIFLQGRNRPIAVHWNWFILRGPIYPDDDGYVQYVVKPGDRVRFELAVNPYGKADGMDYVKNLEVIGKFNEATRRGGVSIG